MHEIPIVAKVETMISLANPVYLDKAGFNPNEPRVPAGNPDGGQWTSEGGSAGEQTETRTESYETVSHPSRRPVVVRLPSKKVGNIIFNETRSLSSLSGSNINDAREKIAYMIRNGENYASEYNTRRPITADDFIANNIPRAETQTYNDSQAAAVAADIGIKQGKDPTNGAIYMSIVDNNTTILNGKILTISTGPFHNSFPNRDVPAKTVYINFSK